ncbi:Aspartate chemoreceptor protein [Jannaschia seosinensis]|uniref:Aspartate chemoreceptor protein n=1 Tax=Jannaschia seosinensis TaxID=313367 RepID=A0A0M7B8W9_9RHOB|nr:methyl-accepting chemotaxis protein [Jannaschia seosinensis]CUH33084.1 Aspartate chemoreceptor protein [Jannaschia seosinensis]
MAVHSIAHDIRKLVFLPLGTLVIVAAAFLLKAHLDAQAAAEIARWEELHAGTDALEAQFMAAKRAEMNFLLTHDMAEAERHAEVLKRLTAQVDEIESRIAGLESRATDSLAALREPLQRYGSAFGVLLDRNETLGLDRSGGLEGEVREAIEAAERPLSRGSAPILRRLTLEMQVHQNDFFLTGNPIHLERLNAVIDAFRARPSAEFPSSMRREEALSALESYQIAMWRYATTYRQERAARRDVVSFLADIEPRLDDAVVAIEDEVTARKAEIAATNRRLLYVCIGLVLATLVAALLFSVRVARRLREPWHQTAQVICSLAEGRADAGMANVRYTEVTDVAAAIARFRDRVLAREKEAADERETARRAAEHEAAEYERIRSEEKERTAAESLALREAQLAKENAVVEEISAVVVACAEGDFGQRLDPEGKEGAIADICGGLNRIGEVTERNLNEVRTALEALAAGQLDHRMTGSGAGIFEVMRETVNATAESLATVIGRIDRSSRTIDHSAAELASAAADLSDRTERNAASLEETAAATSALSSAVGETADTAELANGNICEMRERVRASHVVLERTVAAMHGIRDASAEISKITHLIDDIAFQTNLLSLNAGVEAARAGEAGKGFAVVATEVRDLARRSAAAARNISDLIADSARQVDNGGKLVDDLGAALADISEGVDRTAERMDGIALSAKQQACTISEIDASTAALGDETQANAVIFENTAAATEALHAQAAALAAIVSAFEGIPVLSDEVAAEGRRGVYSGMATKEDEARFARDAAEISERADWPGSAKNVFAV